MYKTVILNKSEGIAIIRINRPEALNSLNDQVLADIESAVDEASADNDIQVIIFTGEGRAFVAGADIEHMSTMNFEEGRKWGAYGAAIFRKIENLEKPTIAAVNGFALGGGCELAMSCDMRIASNKAKFGQPEVGLGITPGFSGTQRLPRLVGKAKAIELTLTADIINADTALSIGLVNAVTEPENLMNDALALAGRIAKNAPLAVRYSNLAIKRGLDVDLDTGIKIETELFGMCFASQDQKEGMAAFLGKRKPEFKTK
jgi:enoyl-CoA hydratase